MNLEDSNSVEESESARLLPRSAWNSQVTYLRLLFRAKKALDRIEKEAGISRIYN
ncbi:hypothetical protein QHH11_18070 [Aphanizomenon sp. PH219]|nr:hypothetical protein [Aphanizomenon sp. 202]MDK2461016.1 hypothetical protein [Aphanizomenon sp. PH219]